MKTDKELKEIALKFKTRGEFINEDRKTYTMLKRRGIFEESVNHMVPAEKMTIAKHRDLEAKVERLEAIVLKLTNGDVV